MVLNVKYRGLFFEHFGVVDDTRRQISGVYEGSCSVRCGAVPFAALRAEQMGQRGQKLDHTASKHSRPYPIAEKKIMKHPTVTTAVLREQRDESYSSPLHVLESAIRFVLDGDEGSSRAYGDYADLCRQQNGEDLITNAMVKYRAGVRSEQSPVEHRFNFIINEFMLCSRQRINFSRRNDIIYIEVHPYRRHI